MAIIFKITTDQQNCGYIKVKDVTSYGTVYPDREVDHVPVWFITEDAVAYNENIQGDREWDFTISNNHTYEIYGILCLVWVAGAYANHAVVYHGGYFYENTSGAPTVNVPGVSVDWTLLTESDFSAFCNAPNVDIDTATEIIDCPDYTIQKQSCYHYKFCDNSGNSYLKNITIYSYDNTQILTFTIDPAVDLCYEFDLTEYGDNVYIVSVTYGIYVSGLFYTPDQIVQYFVIYEFCSLENCSLFTIDKILCSSDPCAEICNPCDPSTVLQQTKDRLALNQLIATFGTLMSMIHVERTRYMGIFTYNITREAYVTKIGMMLQKIKELAVRCGMCYGETVNNPFPDNATFTAVITNATSTRTCTDCE